jgi:N-dimethylarginine dimethylaminohydrolase
MSDAAAAPRFGVTSMVAPLRRVAMRRPGPATFEAEPDLWHYTEPLDAEQLRDQYDAFTERVRESGAEIEWIPPEDDGLADSIFPYDPSFVTAEGAVLLRPGKWLREPESELHRRFYDRIGVPVIGVIESPGTVEGGDCFWIDEGTLAAGRGLRTNRAGINQLGDILAPLGVTLEVFELPDSADEDACLHLLSLVSPLDRDLALVYRPLLPVALYELLCDRGITSLEAPEEEFATSSGLSLNVLALSPRRCIALDGFPATTRLMTEAGCDVALFPGDALCIPCEGGPTCMTLPILRGESPAIASGIESR